MNTEEAIIQIQIDLASMKSDVTWLKRLFTVGLVVTGSLVGIDLTGMI